MSWTPADIPDQTGRVAVVTGSNTGLGLEIATRLAEHGATVILACRNLDKAERAASGIRAQLGGADVDVASLDLADQTNITAFADRLLRDHRRLDLLINNAGLMGVAQSETADGFETTFGVNHLGTFALTQRLRPILEATAGSRVATMSSIAHRTGRMHFDDLMGHRGYRPWRAYCQSKVANLLFTLELQRQFAAGPSDTIAVAAHPGFTATDMFKKEENRSLGNRLSAAAMALCGTVASGAVPMLRAATACDVRGGQFYGPRFQISGPTSLETPTRRARNADAARRLWDISSDLLQRPEYRHPSRAPD